MVPLSLATVSQYHCITVPLWHAQLNSYVITGLISLLDVRTAVAQGALWYFDP